MTPKGPPRLGHGRNQGALLAAIELSGYLLGGTVKSGDGHDDMKMKLNVTQ